MEYDYSTYPSVLRRAFEKNSLSSFATDEILNKLSIFAEFLLSENEKYNLTAIKTPEAAAVLHFADSLTVASFIPSGAKVLDIGAGAGFPSVVLAIARPDIKIVALDSTAKRIDFINQVAKMLELGNLSGVCGRAEELVAASLRASFDFVTARAVAAYPILLELCAPALKTGGTFAAMKGSGAMDELVGADKALALLGVSAPELVSVDLTDGGETFGRNIVLVRKTGKTPPKYPRPYAQIKKKPLY